MTRRHDQTLHCPNCGNEMTTETSFGRWVRNNPELDSTGKGLSVMDTDYVFHRFRTELGRSFQCFMMVEVKTRGGKLSEAQADTAWVLDQLTRNRRQTPTATHRKQAGNGVTKVYSKFNAKDIILKAFGLHVLTFEKLGPDDSQWIKWDGKQITPNHLTKLLCFDLDPDTLLPMDWRSHHPKRRLANLPLFDF